MILSCQPPAVEVPRDESLSPAEPLSLDPSNQLNRVIDLYEFLKTSFNDIESDSEEEAGVRPIQPRKPDGRGKHTKEYRRLRRERHDRYIENLYRVVACGECGAIDRPLALFNEFGTCIRCGYTPAGDCRPIGDYIDFDIRERCRVYYNPRFYIKERINNWRCICPEIPSERLFEIILEIGHELGYQEGGRVSRITREIVYRVVNRLYGTHHYPEIVDPALRRAEEEKQRGKRKYLVFRERWLWIKRWLCANNEFFHFEGAEEWITRFDQNKPNAELIYMLEKMAQVLEKCFSELLYSPNRRGVRRHNRVCRDIIILSFLHAIHPGLFVIYGTDYWKPPITKKSLNENVERLRILLREVREHHPTMKWPKIDFDMETILNTDAVVFDPEEIPDDVIILFPARFQLQTEKMILYREQFRLE